MARRAPILVCSELRVRDLDRAIRFYRALNLRPIARWTMKTGEELAWLRDPNSAHVVELYRVPRRSRFDEPFRSVRRFDTRLLFSARDVTPTLARLRRLGATVRVDFEDGETRLVFLNDPDGNLLELVGWSSTARRRHREPPLASFVRRGRATRA